MKNTKFIALTLAVVMAMYALAPVSLAYAQTTNPLKNISVTDTAGNLTNGVFSVERFAVKGGKIVAIGKLTGNTANGAVNQTVEMPVNIANATCEILSLQLGPLDLNLLGLRIQLSQVNLDITAEQGSGNLLGNLLCQVAKIFDSPGRALGRLANLLNQILGALG